MVICILLVGGTNPKEIGENNLTLVSLELTYRRHPYELN